MPCCNFEPERHIPCTTCGAIACPYRSCENFCNIPRQYKRDKSVTTIELNSEPDSHGRYHFTLFWWAENFHQGPSWRAQCYFTNPQEFMKIERQMGKYQIIKGDSVLQSLPKSV